MQALIESAIEGEAKKRLSRYSRNWYFIHKYRKTFTKRTGISAATGTVSVPISWLDHKHFDPRYCLNHAKFIATGIWSSLRAGTYKPVPARRLEIPKPTGGIRTIDTFSIPDAALAKIFLNRLRLRNAKIFSDRSYAYQFNKTPLDAVIRLRLSLRSNILFISQFDFSGYFDSIGHSYVRQLLSQSGPFLTTAMERKLIDAILTHQFVQQGKPLDTRTCGTPQGNSLSLFVANVAAHPLDEELSRLNGTFARFADDSVVVNTSYEDALKTAEAFHRFSTASGVKINLLKSSGIRMFSDAPAEMAHISEFDFLGYKFRRSGLHMGDRAKTAIKRRCAKIIYNNLLLHLRRTRSLSGRRIGADFHDWDLVTCINELRKFIYGGYSQETLNGFLTGSTGPRNIPGAVSYFALVEDSAIFRELDGWLASILHRAYEHRVRMISSLRLGRVASLRRRDLITGEWYNFPTVQVETRLPSFFTAWRAARMSWSRHGLGGIDSQGMGYAYQ